MLTPQFLLPLADELVIDNFAGGGGASTGIERAIGRPVDIELAAYKLLATAARQGRVLTITQRVKRGAPGHFQSVASVRPVNVEGKRPSAAGARSD